MQGRVARGCAFDRYFIQSIVAAGRKPMSVYSQARATSSKTSLSFPLNDGHLYRLYIGHSIQLNSCVYSGRVGCITLSLSSLPLFLFLVCCFSLILENFHSILVFHSYIYIYIRLFTSLPDTLCSRFARHCYCYIFSLLSFSFQKTNRPKLPLFVY